MNERTGDYLRFTKTYRIKWQCLLVNDIDAKFNVKKSVLGDDTRCNVSIELPKTVSLITGLLGKKSHQTEE